MLIRIPILFFFVHILLDVGFSQESPVWQEYVWEDVKISFYMPPRIRYVFDDGGFSYERQNGSRFSFRDAHIINASEGNTYFSLERYSADSPKAHLDELLFSQRLKKQTVNSGDREIKIVDVTVDGLDEPGQDEPNFTARYIATKSHLYVATAWCRGKKPPAFDRFLSSLTESIASGKSASGSPNSISLSKVAPTTISSITGSISSAEAQGLAERDTRNKSEKGLLLILHTPWAGNYVPTNNMTSKGTVRLLVTFGREGYVEKVRLISGAPGNANRNSLFSVLRTTFLPKLENGSAVETIREVTYRF